MLSISLSKARSRHRIAQRQDSRGAYRRGLAGGFSIFRESAPAAGTNECVDSLVRSIRECRTLNAAGVDVVHLCKSGERLSQAQVMASLESLQGDLFGAQLRSRKAYHKEAFTAGRAHGHKANG